MSICAALIVVTVALVSPVVNGYCDKNVSLTLQDVICPYKPVTVHCAVKKPLNNSNPFLSWQCSGKNGTEERLVFCNTADVLNLECQFGVVYNVTGDCVCNNTIIESYVTFIVPPSDDMILNCTNGEFSELFINSMSAVETPTLDFIELTVKNDIHDIEIVWSDNNNIYSDIEYVLSVSNSSSSTRKPVEFVTTVKRKRLTLYAGVQYNISVTAQRCDGNLTSNPSADLSLNFDVAPTVAKQGEGSVALAVGSTVGGLVLVAILLVVILLLYFWCRRRREKNGGMHAKRSTEMEQIGVSHYLKPVSQSRKNLTVEEAKAVVETIEDDETQPRCGVAAILIDGYFIYYSCCADDESLYYLRKCKAEKDGKNVLTLVGFSCLPGGLKHVRGIGKDSSNNFYVLDGENRRILKFDNSWAPVKHIRGDAFAELFGLLVTNQYVLVCTKRHEQILILDHDLNLCFKLDLPKGPTGIAELDGKYFVTTKHAVLVVEIDFQAGKFLVNKLKTMVMNDGKEESFKNGSELRAISVSGQYLYVVERANRVLCLKYTPDQIRGQLKYVAEAKCSPYAIASDGDKVYCSRSEKKEEFYISKLTQSDGKIIVEDLFKA